MAKQLRRVKVYLEGDAMRAYRWRAVSANGKPLAVAATWYRDRTEAINALRSFAHHIHNDAYQIKE